jgi:hypothetical protein
MIASYRCLFHCNITMEKDEDTLPLSSSQTQRRRQW